MRKTLTTGAAVALLAGLLSPVSFDFGQDANAAGTVGKKQTLLFVGDQAEQALEHIKKTASDPSYNKIKDLMATSDLKAVTNKHVPSALPLDTTGITDLAYPVELVENDGHLRKELQKALDRGVKVYLYGDNLTTERFGKLLNVKEFSAPLPNNAPEMKKLKEQRSDKPVLTLASYETQAVIGYSKNADEVSPIMLGNISGAKNVLPQMYLSSIMQYQASVKEKQEKLAAKVTPKSKFLGLLNLNTANAESYVVNRTWDINTYAYHNTTQIGLMNQDWYLYKENGTMDKDLTYDYFTLEDQVELTSYGYGSPSRLFVDHDIPYDSDHIKEWKPGDLGEQSSEYTFTIPYGVEITFKPGGKIKVDEQGSQTYDYGRWEVTDPNYFWDANLPSQTNFASATYWWSSGTMAVLDIRHTANYEDNYPYDNHVADKLIQIRYDY